MDTLKNKQIADTLTALHEKAEASHLERTHTRGSGQFDHTGATAYMAVNPEEGRLLYFLATAIKAKKIVEFGCSFGISTIYLAAAARNNGGTVVTTDREPVKVTGTRKNLQEAGLSDVVQVLEGDALETLSSVDGPIDFLFLDGAKELYLPVFELLRSKLNKGAIIFADNTDKPETKPLVDYIQNLPSEFSSVYQMNGRVFIASMV